MTNVFSFLYFSMSMKNTWFKRSILKCSDRWYQKTQSKTEQQDGLSVITTNFQKCWRYYHAISVIAPAALNTIAMFSKKTETIY